MTMRCRILPRDGNNRSNNRFDFLIPFLSPLERLNDLMVFNANYDFNGCNVF